MATATRTPRTDKKTVSRITEPAPAPAPARSMNYDEKHHILDLTVKGEEFSYFLAPIAHSLGENYRCFHVVKFVTQRIEGMPASYQVVLNVTQETGICECLGFQGQGKCKHLDALKVLGKLGKI